MSDEKSLQELLREHDLLISDKKSVSFSLKKELLKNLRKSKVIYYYYYNYYIYLIILFSFFFYRFIELILF